jgi:Raf kinase inhibitor-like YbhB/YbcL family protein
VVDGYGMLQHLPKVVGRALQNVRPGLQSLTINLPGINAARSIVVMSSAFEDGRPIPRRYTADGAGVSPPVEWHGVPDGSACIALIIEDADSPTPSPLVHAIVPSLPIRGNLFEGRLSSQEQGIQQGRNSYFRRGYLPPDPPPGHGPHRYAFQIFALSESPGEATGMGRGTFVEWLKRYAIAKGCLLGVYERQ